MQPADKNRQAQLAPGDGFMSAAATMQPSAAMLGVPAPVSCKPELCTLRCQVVPGQITPALLLPKETASVAAPMPSAATHSKQTLAPMSFQGPIVPVTPAPSEILQDAAPEPSSAAPRTASILQSATAMPRSIVEVVDMVNNQLESQQLGHHISEAQAMYLAEVFGDVQMLLDLAGMEDNPMYAILRRDGIMQAMQIFSLRHVLRTIMPQHKSHQQV